MKKILARLFSTVLVVGLFFSINTNTLAASNVDPFGVVEAENADVIIGGGAGCSPYFKICGFDLDRNGYAEFQNVDFAEGASSISFSAYVHALCEVSVKVDSPDSEAIGSIILYSNYSFDTYTINLDTPLTGVHNFYFVITNSSSTYALSMDYWSAEKAPEAPALTLEYSINDWGSGYQVNFNVVNNTDEDIVGWALKIKKSDCQIDQSWCVNVAEDGDYYIITPFDWNSVIPANGSVTFGINGSGTVGDPIEYVFVDPVPVATEELAVSYDVQSWETGFNANFTLANNSDEQLNGWTLKLAKKDWTIESSWSVNVEETDDYYVLTPADWNTIIGAHGTTTFGFQASGEIGDTIDYIFE